MCHENGVKCIFRVIQLVEYVVFYESGVKCIFRVIQLVEYVVCYESGVNCNLRVIESQRLGKEDVLSASFDHLPDASEEAVC